MTVGGLAMRAGAETRVGWQKTHDAALACLARNVKVVPGFDKPVLVEGAEYAGVWMECAPLEGLVYSRVGPTGSAAIARNNHMAFFAVQKEDGQLPASVKMSGMGFGQIQMVVPIAATAWELSRETHDEELLATAYASCARWDGWLERFHNSRGTGLTEGYCTYDTGHDNSPRWKGVPNRRPDSDAKKWVEAAGMPRLCPDLSATTYGARVALRGMAEALGKKDDAARWAESAERIRRLIIEKLWCAEDAAFYDLDADGKFVKVRGDLMTRVMGEHVLDRVKDKKIFEAMWERQLHNPKAMWGRYPLASVAMDDAAFVRPIPRNSWGGASQALTALRVPRWMEYYDKGAEMRVLMERWCEAIVRHGEFRQQMDPMTGEFTVSGTGGYSPAALVFLDFAQRLGFRPA